MSKILVLPGPCSEKMCQGQEHNRFSSFEGHICKGKVSPEKHIYIFYIYIRIYTYIIDIGMQHRHRHAASTGTSNMEREMQN